MSNPVSSRSTSPDVHEPWRYLTPPGAQPIEVNVSQEDFAAMTDLARNSAGAVLRNLEAAGYVKVSYRRVRILAPDALRAMLEA